MSRDTQTPSPPPPPTAQSQSIAGLPAGSGAGASGASGSTSFFLRERERLLGEIAESMGQILNNSNALNRKLEESILVGKEFEPVAALWGKFASSMASMGVPNPQDYDAGGGVNGAERGEHQAGGSGGPNDDKAEGGSEERDALRRSGPVTSVTGETIPHGVAPGGGSWTAAPTSSSS